MDPVVKGVLVSPDGESTMINYGSGGITLFSFAGKETSQVPAKDKTEVTAIAWDPKGRFYAIGYKNGIVTFYDGMDNKEMGSVLISKTSSIASLAYTYLFTPEEVGPLTGPANPGKDHYLYVGCTDGKVYRIDLTKPYIDVFNQPPTKQSGTLLQASSTQSPGGIIALTRYSSFLITAGSNGTGKFVMKITNVRKADQKPIPVNLNAQPLAIAISADDNSPFVAVLQKNHTVVVYNVEGKVVDTIKAAPTHRIRRSSHFASAKDFLPFSRLAMITVRLTCLYTKRESFLSSPARRRLPMSSQQSRRWISALPQISMDN